MEYVDRPALIIDVKVGSKVSEPTFAQNEDEMENINLHTDNISVIDDAMINIYYDMRVSEINTTNFGKESFLAVCQSIEKDFYKN